MGTNLNPDGAKIKALRIKRGWTQEQLAEIAGISTRTVQRAEKANTAAFETLRAVAGAFEMDFDQLLRTPVRDVSNMEPQAIHPMRLPDLDPESVEPIPAVQPDLPVRRGWPMYAIAVSALAAGLVTGVTLTSHMNKPANLHSAVSSSSAAVSSRTVAWNEPSVQVANPPKPVLVTIPYNRVRASARTCDIKKNHSKSFPNHNAIGSSVMRNEVPDPVIQTTKSAEAAGNEREATIHSNTTEPASAVSAATDTAAQGVLDLVPQPAGFEPMPKPRDIFLAHAIPGIVPASGDSLVSTEGNAVEEEDTGAVRQALGLAAKKTGSFMSRVGTSLKRVF
jgi:transcriptional regulator with XRE-family HTH domain